MKISKKVGRSTMARELVLNLNKKKSHFQISKIDRKKLTEILTTSMNEGE